MVDNIQCIQCGSCHYEKTKHITEELRENYLCVDCERDNYKIVLESKWYKTKDVSPPFCENVLIWSEGMSITGAYLMEVNLWAIIDWDEYDQYLPLYDVDYWKMSPKPPNGAL